MLLILIFQKLQKFMKNTAVTPLINTDIRHLLIQDPNF